MPAFSSIIAAIGAATAVGSGIAKAASGGDKRPKLGEPGQEVASNLANTFASRVSGTPQLGQGLGQPKLGQPNTGIAPATPNLGEIKARLGNAGRSLGMG